MNALSAWSLLQLKNGQTAGDRPDIFGAYAHMNQAVLDRDLNYRRARAMRMGDGAAREFSTMLADACASRARLTLFFPPDNMAIVARYRQSDAAGLDAFKQMVRDAVARHNASCASKAQLFDFMAPNPLTTETLKDGLSRGLCRSGALPPARRPVAAQADGRNRLIPQLVVDVVAPEVGQLAALQLELPLLATATATPATTTAIAPPIRSRL